MRTDILDLHHFYESPLGITARDLIRGELASLWADEDHIKMAGFGFSTPYLSQYPKARTLLALAPDAQGVMRWPPRQAGAASPIEKTPATEHNTARNKACLIHEGYWPLPDRSMDRILIIHGLEEVRDASRLLREAWRVLADDGKLIIVAAQRRGLWAAYDTTPMAAGRPWLRGQLGRLIERNLFTPLQWRRALHFPPSGWKIITQSAGGWEKIGKRIWPGFCGVLIVEAGKAIMHPVTGTPQRVLNVIRPKLRGQLIPSVPGSSPKPVISLEEKPDPAS